MYTYLTPSQLLNISCYIKTGLDYVHHIDNMYMRVTACMFNKIDTRTRNSDLFWLFPYKMYILLSLTGYIQINYLIIPNSHYDGHCVSRKVPVTFNYIENRITIVIVFKH